MILIFIDATLFYIGTISILWGGCILLDLVQRDKLQVIANLPMYSGDYNVVYLVLAWASTASFYYHVHWAWDLAMNVRALHLLTSTPDFLPTVIVKNLRESKENLEGAIRKVVPGVGYKYSILYDYPELRKSIAKRCNLIFELEKFEQYGEIPNLNDEEAGQRQEFPKKLKELTEQYNIITKEIEQMRHNFEAESVEKDVAIITLETYEAALTLSKCYLSDRYTMDVPILLPDRHEDFCFETLCKSKTQRYISRKIYILLMGLMYIMCAGILYINELFGNEDSQVYEKLKKIPTGKIFVPAFCNKVFDLFLPKFLSYSQHFNINILQSTKNVNGFDAWFLYEAISCIAMIFILPWIKSKELQEISKTFDENLLQWGKLHFNLLFVSGILAFFMGMGKISQLLKYIFKKPSKMQLKRMEEGEDIELTDMCSLPIQIMIMISFMGVAPFNTLIGFFYLLLIRGSVCYKVEFIWKRIFTGGRLWCSLINVLHLSFFLQIFTTMLFLYNKNKIFAYLCLPIFLIMIQQYMLLRSKFEMLIRHRPEILKPLTDLKKLTINEATTQLCGIKGIQHQVITLDDILRKGTLVLHNSETLQEPGQETSVNENE